MLRVGVVCVQARLRVVAAAVMAGAEVAAEAAPAVAAAQKGATANAVQSAVKAFVTSFIAQVLPARWVKKRSSTNIRKYARRAQWTGVTFGDSLSNRPGRTRRAGAHRRHGPAGGGRGCRARRPGARRPHRPAGGGR